MCRRIVIAMLMGFSASLSLACCCCLPSATTTTGQSTEPGEKGAYTREEFKKLVMGKTEDEVLKALGKPDSTSESPVSVLWRYKGRTMDPVTGKTDFDAYVTFKDGKVTGVTF